MPYFPIRFFEFGLAGLFCEAVPGRLPPWPGCGPRLPDPRLKDFEVPDMVLLTPEPEINCPPLPN
jgi:hypothetical protein